MGGARGFRIKEAGGVESVIAALRALLRLGGSASDRRPLRDLLKAFAKKREQQLEEVDPALASREAELRAAAEQLHEVRMDSG